MSNILKLFKKSLQVVALAGAMIGCIFFTTKPDEKHLYQASMLKTDLLSKTPSPRIILFGGSNIAFGIDSELLERELGMPVVNDGLHVGLGVAPLNELKKYIQPDDIIIVSLEYYNFTDKTAFYGQPQYLADWIEFSQSRIWDIHDPIRQMPSIYTIMLQRKINRLTNYYLYGLSLDEGRGFYTGDKFNEHGDFTGHLGENSQIQFEIANSIYPANNLDEAYIFLENFHQYAISKGAMVYYEAQAHRETNCEVTGIRNLNRFFTSLKNKTTIPMLTDMDQLCLPDDYFYDTPYHLNEQGRRIRTELLIKSLKIALGVK